MISKDKKRIVITLDKKTLMLLEELQNENPILKISKSTIIRESIWAKWENRYER